jgi:hypothetical protein
LAWAFSWLSDQKSENFEKKWKKSKKIEKNRIFWKSGVQIYYGKTRGFQKKVEKSEKNEKKWKKLKKIDFFWKKLNFPENRGVGEWPGFSLGKCKKSEKNWKKLKKIEKNWKKLIFLTKMSKFQ